METQFVEIATDIDMDTALISNDNADENTDAAIQNVDMSEYNFRNYISFFLPVSYFCVTL